MADRERLICAASDLAEQGKGVRFEMNRSGKLQPAFVVRFEGKAHAFLNQCGHVPVELDWQEGEFFDLDKGDYGLKDVRCETWEGFIYINLDPDAIPVHVSEPHHGQAVALLGCFQEPGGGGFGLLAALGHAATQQETQTILRFLQALFGGPGQPDERLGIVADVELHRNLGTA